MLLLTLRYIQRHTRQIPVMDANATSYEVSDLKPYTTYTFSVSATTKAGTGPAISVSSTTLQGGEALQYVHIKASMLMK